MKIEVFRFNDTRETTMSIVMVDGKAICSGLEDEQRTIKLWGETRIPDGTYVVKLRTVGGHHLRYAKKFPDFHQGMLHIIGVPNFKYVLIHIGNTDDDTAGCLLTGSVINFDNLDYHARSTDAYVRFYKEVIKAFDQVEPVSITFRSIYKSHIS